MQQSKLIEIFNKLHKQHIFFIKKILTAEKEASHPIFVLFNYILHYHPNNLSKSELNKETTYTFVSKKKEYNDKQMLKWMSELLKYIERGIIQENMEADIYYQKNSLAKFYLKNNLIKNFDIEFKELNELVEKKEDNFSYLKKFELEELHLEKQLNSNNRYGNYQVLSDNLKAFYETNLFRINNLSNTDLKNDIKENTPNNKLYLIHQQISNLLKEEGNDNYNKCFQLISEIKSEIKDSEIRICIMILINFCIIKINSKTPTYLEKLFSLYHFLIDAGLILEENKTISISTYKNFCTVGLRLGQISYIENFIQDYKNKLPKDVQNDIYQYNLAHVFFYKKSFEDVLKLLSNVRFKDVFYKLSSRRLQIKTYFVMYKNNASYFEVLESSLNAFKKYIYTNKEINEHYLANNKNFLKFANKLLTLNKSETQQFLADLDATKQMAEYDWLKEIATNIK